jgi:hypothetical protein
MKCYRSSFKGMKLSNADKEKLKEIYHSGETHAKPIEDIRHLYPTELITGYKNE